MSRVNRSWMAVVAAALLLGTLVGVVCARPNESPQAQNTTRKVTLTGTDFTPTEDDWDFDNRGGWVACNTSFCYFTAPVVFPCLPAVTVERIKLHVKDSDLSGTAQVTLRRANPPTGGDAVLGSADSPIGTSGGVKTYDSGAINKAVWPSQRAYILLWIGSTDIDVYGVTVEYHVNS